MAPNAPGRLRDARGSRQRAQNNKKKRSWEAARCTRVETESSCARPYLPPRSPVLLLSLVFDRASRRQEHTCQGPSPTFKSMQHAATRRLQGCLNRTCFTKKYLSLSLLCSKGILGCSLPRLQTSVSTRAPTHAASGSAAALISHLPFRRSNILKIDDLDSLHATTVVIRAVHRACTSG